jgi:NADH-quinone oxidoreductase subunit L
VVAAMFHLFTHAFFKALLFLGSGSVMHAMGGVIDMRRFGGLRHRMPYTCATFAVGSLALSGIWPFAGFFSKDEILIAIKSASNEGLAAGIAFPGIYLGIYWIAVLTAFLTAFYTGRAFFLTFWGPEKLPSDDDPEAETSSDSSHATPTPAHGDDHGHGEHGSHFGHEAGTVMTAPLMVLAVCAFLVGFVFGPTHWFHNHIIGKTFAFDQHLSHFTAHEQHEAHGWGTPALGLAVSVLGLGLSYVFYATRSPIPARIAATFNRPYRASLNKFYVDEFYDSLIVRTTLAAAKVSEFLDTYVVDGMVRLTSWVPRIVGLEVLAPFQNGLIQFYAAASALGVAALLWVLLWN